MPKTGEGIHLDNNNINDTSYTYKKNTFSEEDKNVTNSSGSSIENNSPEVDETLIGGIERNSFSSISILSEEDAYDEIFEDDLLPLEQLAPYLAHLESQHYYRVEETDDLIIMDDQGDVIYEEVVLIRSTLNQRLGLTLCYQHNDYLNQDAIYINEIEKNSVAGNCKKIQIGDQIIQVNGINVRSRAQAMNEFSKQNLQVTMLLARSFNMDLNNSDNIHQIEGRPGDETIKDKPKKMFSKNRCFNRNHSNLSPLPEQSVSLECDIDDELLTDQNSNNSVLEKDSGLSRGTDSDPDIYTVPYDNLEKVNNITKVSPPSITSMPQLKRNNKINSSLTSTTKFEKNLEEELKNLHLEMELIKKDCDNLITMSSTFIPPKKMPKNNINKNLISGIIKSPILQRPLPTPVGILNKTHLIGNSSLPNSPILSVRNGGKKYPHFANIIEETSSAYNTGNDSCRSTPNKNDQINFIDTTLQHINSLNKHQLLAGDSAATMGPFLNSKIGNQSKSVLLKSSQLCKNQFIENQRLTKSQKEVHFNDNPSIIIHKNIDNNKKEEGTYHTVKNHSKFRLPKYTIKNQIFIPKPIKSSTLKKTKDSIKYRPGETTYARPEDLEETIKLQQQALRKAMANKEEIHCSSSLPSSPIISHSKTSDKTLKYATQKQSNLLSLAQKVKSSQTADPINYEWKVKRRSDGSRYIIRRPLRTHQIRAQREEQLNKERTGVSTDDDAASEMKLGKFWTREERKKHLEKAKAYKQRQLQKLIDQEKNVPDQMIVNLSNKKMMKKKGQQVYDKFVTIQEFLTHGSRDPNCPVIEGVLSVTTV
ncbi:Slo-interacting protein 1 [Strongyloides ratti]|uniref:Slo-interacting protein 1 n=1 Tax=Strongyloides ratti TaxID=34506 RepID=A0A090LS03_STRRB|nr:Slo-interacting protein 1 [Strongyloides ratti]CEF70992.1 Slo-interacting protein 1 [Strongyloides ratti]